MTTSSKALSINAIIITQQLLSIRHNLSAMSKFHYEQSPYTFLDLT